MKQTSLVIFTSIGGVIAFLFVPSAMEGQPQIPDGSVVIRPSSASPSDCLERAGSSEDDTARIQQAIDRATGTVFFKAGCYYLRQSLHLRSGRTYMGEGSWKPPYASTLVQIQGLQQSSRDPVTDLGAPIFSVNGVVRSVTIVGLAFDAPDVVKAKGIAAVSPEAVLIDSTLVGNYFWAELAECIDVPMVATRIERNQFGTHGGNRGKHRHIRSVHSGGLLPASGKDNWIVNNVFRSACCETAPGNGSGSESVLFESQDQLHIIRNDFEDGRVDTTLRIHGASQVFIEGNWFEKNHGQAQMTVSSQGSDVQVKDNRYIMDGYGGDPPLSNMCNGTSTRGNCFILEFEQAPSSAGLGVSLSPSHVSMGYETAGGSFAPMAELVDPRIFEACQLTIIGPFYPGNFAASQVGGNPKCH